MVNRFKISKTLEDCIDLVESKGESCPVYVSFEKDHYQFTKNEMYNLLKGLNLIDKTINQDDFED